MDFPSILITALQCDESLEVIENLTHWNKAKGKAEGKAEGLEEAKRDNARRMKADNMPTELIAKYTGLSAEVIDEL